MADLFKKLNTLVKAGLHDLLSSGDNDQSGGAPLPAITPGRLGVNIDRELKAMHERVNDALAYEEKLRKTITALEEEIRTLDAQADAAVERGDEVSARSLIDELRRAERRQAMLHGDLYQHQVVAQELTDRVKELEVMVDAAKRVQTGQAPPENASPLPSLSDVLRRTRETITSMGETIEAAGEVQSPADQPEQSPPASPNSPSAADDLEQRRQRLAKKD